MHQAAQAAQQLLCARQYGILSSLSKKLPGYPLGSVTPYVLDGDSSPIILISDIAQHTANLKSDPRCSLTVLASDSGDVQADARICVIADAEPLPEDELEELKARYLRFYPEAQSYFTAHNFHFWRLKPVKLRYIGGFGNIHWLNPDETLRANPFAGTAESAACQHMNSDHADALKRYCEFSGIAYAHQKPEMVGVDSEALYLRSEQGIHRLPFRRHVLTQQHLREETIAMCQADYWPAARNAA